MLKRTERVIDAVKLIELLEGMEGKEAELSVKRKENVWNFEYKCDGEIISERGNRLTDMVEKAIGITRRRKDGGNNSVSVLSGENMEREEQQYNHNM